MITREYLKGIFYNVVNFPYRQGDSIDPSVRQCVDDSSLVVSAASAIAFSGQGSSAAVVAALGGYIGGQVLVGLAFRPFIR